MSKSQTLKLAGINHLKTYFSSEKDINLIKQKFSNISGKTGQYSVPDTLYQKRTARKNRVLIPFEHVVKSNITYDQLKTFEGDVVVEFVNSDYFDQLKLDESQQNDVFKILKDKLGCDEEVSAIIVIRGTGNSSSQIQRDALKELKDFLKASNLEIKDVLIQRNSKDYSGQGNDKWEGFVYVSIRGGQQDSVDFHIDYNIPSSRVQLFNPSVEYAGSEVSDDITLVLIYFALFSVPKQNRNSEWKKIEKSYLEYFSERRYEGKDLKEYVVNHISLKLVEGELSDPIQVKPIRIEDFAISEREPDSLDITHQISVNKYSYVWDEDMKILLSPARPTNLFWSKHMSNMMQQDFSLKEYFIHQREIVKKWDEYGIDNL